MSNGAQAFAQVFGDRVRACPGEKDEETIRAMSPARPSSRLATYFHVHLVSDSTGETLNAMAKAVIARFDGVIPIEHIYALVRSPRQMERVLSVAREAGATVTDLNGHPHTATGASTLAAAPAIAAQLTQLTAQPR